MEMVPVSGQASFCNDNQPKSGSDIIKSWSLAGGAYIHTWVGDRQHLHFAVSNSGIRKSRNVVHKEIL